MLQRIAASAKAQRAASKNAVILSLSKDLKYHVLHLSYPV
jgi:hypothetical protein